MRKIALLTILLMSLPAAHSDDNPPTNVYQHIKSEHWEFTPKTHRQIQAEKAAQQRQEDAWAREAQRQAQAQARAQAQAQMQYEVQQQAKTLKRMQDDMETLEAITYSRVR